MPNLKQRENGISIIELVLVLSVVGFLALLINTLPSSIASISKSRHTSLARDIASREMDYLRKQDYANLSNGLSNFSDSGLAGLPASAATSEIDDCPAEICNRQEQAKQVKVKVAWNESGDSKAVELVTIINDKGLGK